MTGSGRLAVRASLFAFAVFTSFLVHAAGAIATAVAEGGLRYYWIADRPDRRAAERDALARCAAQVVADRHRAACTLGASADGPAHWAVVAANNGGVGWAYAADAQWAIDTAYKDCVRRSGGRCFGKAAATWTDRAPSEAGAVGAESAKADVVAPLSAAPAAWSGMWTRIGGGAELQFFVDTVSLKRSGDGVTAWVLYSMADESVVNLNEHRCRAGQYRTLAWTHFAEPMARGESQPASQPEPWRAVATDAFYRGAMNAVCRGAAPGKTKR